MYSTIITKDNFNDVKHIMKDVKDRANESYKKENRGFASQTIYVVGEEAISMFEKKYGCSFFNCKKINTDGKTSAKQVP